MTPITALDLWWGSSWQEHMREEEAYLMARSQREEQTSIPQSSLRSYAYWSDLRIRTFQEVIRFLYLSVELENLSSVRFLLVKWLNYGLCDQSWVWNQASLFLTLGILLHLFGPKEWWQWCHPVRWGTATGNGTHALWEEGSALCTCWSTVVRLPLSLVKSLFLELCGGGQWATCGWDPPV